MAGLDLSAMAVKLEDLLKTSPGAHAGGFVDKLAAGLGTVYRLNGNMPGLVKQFTGKYHGDATDVHAAVMRGELSMEEASQMLATVAACYLELNARGEVNGNSHEQGQLYAGLANGYIRLSAHNLSQN